MKRHHAFLVICFLLCASACVGEVHPSDLPEGVGAASAEALSADQCDGLELTRNAMSMRYNNASDPSDAGTIFFVSARNRSQVYSGLTIYLYEQRPGGAWEARGTSWTSIPPGGWEKTAASMEVDVDPGTNWSAVAYLWNPCTEEFEQAATTFIGADPATALANYRLFNDTLCYHNFNYVSCGGLVDTIYPRGGDSARLRVATRPY